MKPTKLNLKKATPAVRLKKNKKKGLIFELGFYLGWQLKEWLLKLAYMGWCYDAIWLLKWAYVNWREREREKRVSKPLTVVAGGRSCETWLVIGDKGA